MALQNSDLFIVQRSNQSYKMPASQLSSFISLPTVGNGTITITQTGRAAQTFTVNQTGNTTVSLGDTGNTKYNFTTASSAGVRLSGSDSSIDNVYFTGTGGCTITRNSSSQLTFFTADTNTTYSAGNGISLSGTTFSVSGGDGLSQESSGLKVDTSVIRTSGDQTLGGTKTFSSQIFASQGARVTVASVSNGASVNFAISNLFRLDGPGVGGFTNAVAGSSGLLLCVNEITNWTGAWLWPGSGDAPETPANSVIPYYVSAGNEVRLGAPTLRDA